MNVLDFHRRLIHENPHRQGQSAERHDVDRLAGGPQQHHGAQQRKGDVQNHDERATPVAKENQHHEPRQNRAGQRLEDKAAQGVGYEWRLVELQAYIDVIGHNLAEIGNRLLYRVDDGKRGRVRALGHRYVHGAAAVHVGIRCNDVRSVLDCADIAQVDGRARRRADGRAQEFRKISTEGRVRPRNAVDLSGPHVPGGHHQRRGADRRDGFVRRNAVLPELVRIERDDDRPLVPSKWRWSRNPGQGGKQRTHAVQGKILQLALRARGTAEQQLADGDAAGVKSRDEGRHRARRHERPRAVDITYGLRHGLRHVRAFVEDQFHQRRALDALALHAADSRDVEEVILVIVGEVAFHLGRVHASVRLSHINRRLSNLGEDVHRHPPHRKKSKQGDGGESNHHRNRTVESG